MNTDAKRQLLRHTLATLAYRGAKALRGAPEDFALFQTELTANTPGKLLGHLCDLMDWGYSMASGDRVYRSAENMGLSWAEQVERFHQAIATFDGFLASDNELLEPAEKLFQGPIADALTHIGQLNLLRRMAGSPVKGENYFVADIEIGRLSTDQAPPNLEF